METRGYCSHPTTIYTRLLQAKRSPGPIGGVTTPSTTLGIKPRQATYKGDREFVGGRVPAATAIRLREVCARVDVSVSDLVGDLIARFLATLPSAT